MSDENQREDREAEITTCPVCGATVEPDDRFCRNCGASLGAGAQPVFSGPQPGVPADAPTERLEELDFDSPTAAVVDDEPPLAGPAPPPSDYDVSDQAVSTRSDGGSSSNRTWLIVLLIAVLVVLVCCCLMLIGFTIAAADSSFQDEVDAALRGWSMT